MDLQPQQQSQSISDDQELAKVLAGVSGEVDEAIDTIPEQVLPPTPMPTTPQVVDEPSNDDNSMQPLGPMPEMPLAMPTTTFSGDTSLESIKQQALGELRPLVDKLDASPEEKFDTYLLLIRSTDDKELIAPAHEAARSIADEARRAQALLDIIKEIDFLSSPKQS